jgi:hypothetical protein
MLAQTSSNKQMEMGSRNQEYSNVEVDGQSSKNVMNSAYLDTHGVELDLTDPN